MFQWAMSRRVVELYPGLGGVIYFVISPGPISGWVKPRWVEGNRVERSLTGYGSSLWVHGQNTSTQLQANALQPHVVACQKKTTNHLRSLVPPFHK